MHQSWRDLSFLHFSCEPEELRRLIPEELEIDTFEGRAWIGLVPFRMLGIRPPYAPAAPWLSAFPETNVRTYVHHRGQRPGVWFFSLDAARWLACAYARLRFALPYHHARMSVVTLDEIHYWSERRDASTDIRVRPGEAMTMPQPGSLEFFLVERYLLYAKRGGQLFSGQVHHPPYPIRSLDLLQCDETLVKSNGFEPRDWEHVCFSPGVDVEVFGVQVVE